MNKIFFKNFILSFITLLIVALPFSFNIIESQNSLDILNTRVEFSQNVASAASQADGTSSPSNNSSSWWGVMGGFLGLPMNIALSFYQYIIYVPLSFVFMLVGSLLDFTIRFATNSANIASSNDTIELGWRVFRDIGNLLFVFILLYHAFMLMVSRVKMEEAGVSVLKIVAVAIGVNFTLVIGKLGVDLSNVVSLWFLDAIYAFLANNQIGLNPLSGAPSISYAIVESTAGLNSLTGFTDQIAKMGTGTLFFSISLRIALIAYGTYAFGKVAIFMLARIISIIISLILSPIVVLSYIVPGKEGKMKDLRNQILDEYQKSLLMPPVFLLLMYIFIRFISSEFYRNAGAGYVNDLAQFGLKINIGDIFKYFLALLLLQKIMDITLSFGTEVGKKFESIAEKVGQTAVGAGLAVGTGGAALAARATIGRVASNAVTDQGLINKSAQGGIGGLWAKTKLGVYGKAANASFDLRNKEGFQEDMQGGEKKAGSFKMGGSGFLGTTTKGQEGGYKAEKDEKDKAKKEIETEITKIRQKAIDDANKIKMDQAKQDELDAAQDRIDDLDKLSDSSELSSKSAEVTAAKTREEQKAKETEIENKAKIDAEGIFNASPEAAKLTATLGGLTTDFDKLKQDEKIMLDLLRQEKEKSTPDKASISAAEDQLKILRDQMAYKQEDILNNKATMASELKKVQDTAIAMDKASSAELRMINDRLVAAEAEKVSKKAASEALKKSVADEKKARGDLENTYKQEVENKKRDFAQRVQSGAVHSNLTQAERDRASREIRKRARKGFEEKSDIQKNIEKEYEKMRKREKEEEARKAGGGTP